MHDLLAPPGPLFSAPCGTAGGSDVTAIDVPEAVIEAPFQAQLDLQFLDHGKQPTLFSPLVEVVVYRLPRRVLFGQVAPGRAGAKNPQDSVEHQATIRGRPARVRGDGKPVANPLPLLIRELVTRDRTDLRRRPCTRTSGKSAILETTSKGRFSDRA